MPNEGYTVSPIPTENQDGTVSYDFQVQQGNLTNHDTSDDYYLDNQGRAHHRYADYDVQQAIEQEPGYQRPIQQSDYDMSGLMTAEDEQFIQDSIGGAEGYQRMISHASQFLTPEQKYVFNEVLQSGD